MAACHTVPFIKPGLLIDSEPAAPETAASAAESCDWCGSNHIVWRRCKLICEDCRQINKSCADL